MDTAYTLSWHDSNAVVQEEVICGINNEDINEIISTGEETDDNNVTYTAEDDNNVVYTTEVCEEVVVEDENLSTEGENVMYLTEDNMLIMQTRAESEEPFMECQVTEEVVTQDWSDCQELVIGSVEQVGDDTMAPQGDDDVMIPLPTDQDQYLASRPYPCDFCSRRFRKKANLMNHMVAHQTDRPHGCNLCGARYIRKCDLMNHLKIHAYVPDTEEHLDDGELLDSDFNDRASRIDDVGGNRSQRGVALSMNKSRYQVQGKGGQVGSLGTLGSPGKKRRRKIKDEYDSDFDSHSSSHRQHYAEHQIMVDEEGNVITTSMQHNQLSDSHHQQQQHSSNNEPEKHHYPIIDPRKPFVCQHCGVAFAREKALASHARMHQGDSPFECRLCDEMFWDVDRMREHMRLIHGEGDFNPGSGQRQQQQQQQTDYDEYSEDDKFGEFFCNECGESFSRADQLKRHARIHTRDDDMLELEEYMHVCNVCGDSFAEPLDLLAHAECHARTETPRCSVCSAGFGTQQDLAAHVAAEHAATLPPNACLLCGKICRDKRSLIKHNLEHSREKSFTCPQCNKAFNNRARLKRHLLSHRDKAVTCDVCAQSFPDGRSLMNHRHSHSSVSGRQFPCEECGKSFGSRSSQQIHVRIHTGERPYGCRFCWKAFADGGTLRKHERIHTGEKPYACAVCPRAFNQRVVLREHIRSHHSGPDPNYSHTTTPYCCNVCSDMFATSQDLIVHLIHHCDLNTAMRRQPQVGPRKYKRRRKLKPHELEMTNDDDVHMLMDDYREREIQPHPRHKSAILSGSSGKRHYSQSTSNQVQHNNTTTTTTNNCEDNQASSQHRPSNDDEATDSDQEHLGGQRRSSQGGPRKLLSSIGRRRNSSTSNNLMAGGGGNKDPLSLSAHEDDQQQSLADVIKSLTSAGDGKAPPKLKKRKEIVATARPKMIHTQKTKISVETNEGGRIRHKTKTLVTRTQQQQQQQSAQWDLDERMRPRTKNVSYHILNSDGCGGTAVAGGNGDNGGTTNNKLPLATFPSDDMTAQAVSSILDPDYEEDGGDDDDDDNAPTTNTEAVITEEEVVFRVKQEQQQQQIACLTPMKEEQPVQNQHTVTVKHHHDDDVAYEQQNYVDESMMVVRRSGGDLSVLANGQSLRSSRTRGVIVPKRMMDPDTKIVKIIKGGMIISKRKQQQQQQQQQEQPAQGANIKIVQESGNVGVYIDQPQFIEVKQEVEPGDGGGSGGLSELAEICGSAAAAARITNVFQCEMCSAVFTDRHALLEHVPIHI